MTMTKKLPLLLMTVMLLSTPALAIHNISITQNATKYRNHGAEIHVSETKTLPLEIEAWVSTTDGMPIERIYQWKNKETGQPHNFNLTVANQTEVITWNIDDKYQKGRTYQLHVEILEDNPHLETENFTVTRIKQPNLLGDTIMVLTKPVNLMMIFGGIIILTLLLVFFKVVLFTPGHIMR